jgi:hypothetical protein
LVSSLLGPDIDTWDGVPEHYTATEQESLQPFHLFDGLVILLTVNISPEPLTYLASCSGLTLAASLSPFQPSPHSLLLLPKEILSTTPTQRALDVWNMN